MATVKNRKMDVPDIGGLLNQIAEARDSGELPKTERQHVSPVSIKPSNSNTSKEVKSLEVKEARHFTGKEVNRQNGEIRGPMGRKSIKREDVEYIKTSPRIPKTLKKQVDQALIDERFQDEQGRSITTVDEIVTLALERLLATK